MSQDTENYITPIFPLKGGEDTEVPVENSQTEAIIDEGMESDSFEDYSDNSVNEESINDSTNNLQLGGAPNDPRSIDVFLEKHASKIFGMFVNGYSDTLARKKLLPPFTDLIPTKLPRNPDMTYAEIEKFEDLESLFSAEQRVVPIYYILRFRTRAWNIFIQKIKPRIEEEQKTNPGFTFFDLPMDDDIAQVLLLTDIAIRLYILAYLNIYNRNVFCFDMRTDSSLFNTYVKGPPAKMAEAATYFTDLKKSLPEMSKCFFGKETTSTVPLEALYRLVIDFGMMREFGLMGNSESIKMSDYFFFPTMEDFLDFMIEKSGSATSAAAAASDAAAAAAAAAAASSPPPPGPDFTPEQKEAVLRILYRSDAPSGKEEVFLVIDESDIESGIKAAKAELKLTRPIFDKILTVINTDLGGIFIIKKKSEFEKLPKNTFEVVKSPSDGWCFYHSLIRQVGAAPGYDSKTVDEIKASSVPTEAETKPLVEAIKTWILDPTRDALFKKWEAMYETNPSHAKGSYKTYIDSLDDITKKQWADPEYGIGAAAASILKTTIEILEEPEGDKDNYFKIQIYPYLPIVSSSAASAAVAPRTLRLEYLSRVHYNILLPKEADKSADDVVVDVEAEKKKVESIRTELVPILASLEDAEISGLTEANQTTAKKLRTESNELLDSINKLMVDFEKKPGGDQVKILEEVSKLSDKIKKLFEGPGVVELSVEHIAKIGDKLQKLKEKWEAEKKGPGAGSPPAKGGKRSASRKKRTTRKAGRRNTHSKNRKA